MWNKGTTWGREFSIKTALESDRKLWTREIINKQTVDIDETWIEED